MTNKRFLIKKKVLVPLIFSVFCMLGCITGTGPENISQKQDVDNYQQLSKAGFDKLMTELYQAYSDSNLKDLDAFFEDWYNKVPSISDKELSELGVEERSVYDIFKALYQPMSLPSILGSEWGDLYGDVKFLIIQDWIHYCVLNTIIVENTSSEPLLTDSLGNNLIAPISRFYSPYIVTFSEDTLISETVIESFRPQTNISQQTPLHLTPLYHTVIDSFLGNESLPWGTGSIMSPAEGRGESAQRANFINQRVNIFHEHWGSGWMLESAPVVYQIVLDGSMTIAYVNFFMIYQGGHILLRKENGEWKILEAMLTWIT